jgi:hypothetical protein
MMPFVLLLLHPDDWLVHQSGGQQAATFSASPVRLSQ